ncbi:MAG: TetR/AcrR family transcriptional regulator [Sphingorhabdus sp.]|jgi:AcrR family transcriptional regulator|uniref:TetR/AcrR family transcriptional regulator n=1 Tax=Sphingorhabdus sp. TaxID=1902408 RepID=UPI00273F4D6B|nr:TetR/AcrR family transcriptional regulator [Sphingorhabdus sp.]MDP4928086.1 TetR/AcrR family transcriptional regulator [Sphingorhabdus sp.]
MLDVPSEEVLAANGDAPAPRRRGRPAVDTANAIDESVFLAAACTMFAERGYDSTTLRELARNLGVSHNLLNVRFGLKANLWRAAVDWRMVEASTSVVAAFEGDGDAEQRLRDLVRRFCEWATENRDIVSISYHEGQRDSWRLEYIAQTFIRPFQARLDALIDEVRAVRPVHALSTTALMALLVQGVGFYFASKPLQMRLGESSDVSHETALVQARQFADFLIGGLLTTGS